MPGKLGHVCRCRRGYGGTPGPDGSGCAPNTLTLDSAGLRVSVGRGQRVAAAYAKAGDAGAERIDFAQLRDRVAALQGADGAVTSLESDVQALAEGPVAANAAKTNAVAASIALGQNDVNRLSAATLDAELSAGERQAQLDDTADANAAAQAQLTASVDDAELDLLGLVTDVGALDTKLSDLQAHVKTELEDEVRVCAAAVSSSFSFPTALICALCMRFSFLDLHRGGAGL